MRGENDELQHRRHFDESILRRENESDYDDGVFGATATAKINKTTGKTTFTKEVNIGVIEGAGYTGALQNNGGGSWSKNAFVTVLR